MRFIPATLVIAALCVPIAARAQTPAPDETKTTSSRVKEWGVPLGALGGSLWLSIALNADDCSWCDRDASGADTLNGLDRRMRATLLWPESKRRAAATTSDVMAGSMVAVPYLLLWPRNHHAEAIQTMTWVVAADAVVTAIPKRIAARERPYVHFNDPFARPDSHPNASFPSNHTSRSFASVFAAARLCEMYDCPHGNRIWWIGLPLATATGLMRIGADKHYAVDVFTGAGVGAAVGWYVPALVRRVKTGRSAHLSIQPSLGPSAGVSVLWDWR
jgi:membrane-associated phospholipid phosphatase